SMNGAMKRYAAAFRRRLSLRVLRPRAVVLIGGAFLKIRGEEQGRGASTARPATSLGDDGEALRLAVLNELGLPFLERGAKVALLGDCRPERLLEARAGEVVVRQPLPVRSHGLRDVRKNSVDLLAVVKVEFLVANL